MANGSANNPESGKRAPLAEFISEADVYLKILSEKLLAAESAAKKGDTFPEKDLKEMFRAAHNIKSLASFLSLKDIAGITHEMETALSRLRRREIAFSGRVVDILLEVFDFLEKEFKSLRETSKEITGADGAVEKIHAAVSREIAGARKCEPEPKTELPAPELVKMDELARLSGELALLENKISGLAARLEKEISARDEKADALLFLKSFCEAARGEVQAFRKERPDAEQAMKKIVSLLSAIDRQSDKLGAFHNDNLTAASGELNDFLHAFKIVSVDISACVAQGRMVSAERLLAGFKRAVRDIGKKLSKEAVLEITAQGVEIDKEIANALRTPLLHLIRNAIDHGLEEPQCRSAAGKAPQGTIALSAKRESGFLVLAVKDDGRGMDPEKIAVAAVKKGLCSAAQAGGLDADGKLKLIFLHGFSTAEQITGLSGRGVGMDAVAEAVNALVGVIDIKTEPGRGTAFIIKIPDA